MEDGKPVTLSSFSEHGAAQAVSTQATAPAQPLPPNIFTNEAPAAASPIPPNILLIDSLDTPVPNQAIVQMRMLEFVAKLPATARVEGPYTFANGKSLRLARLHRGS